LIFRSPPTGSATALGNGATMPVFRTVSAWVEKGRRGHHS
jgi:hypothetical protein